MKRIFVLALVFLLGFPAQAYRKKSKPKPSWTRPTTLIQNLDWDIQVKRLLYEYYLGRFMDNRLAVDPPKRRLLLDRLQKIQQRLKPHALFSDLPWEVHLVDHDYPNAFALPGGGVVFFQGLFNPEKGFVDEKDDDELAAVMSHEMAHAALRHSYQQVQRAKGINFVGNLLSLGVDTMAGETWSEIFDVVYYVPLGLVFIKYNRKQEAQADLEGLYMMIRAGYNPEKMIRIWERAYQQDKKEKHGLLDSHPSSKERSKKLAEQLEKIREGEKVR